MSQAAHQTIPKDPIDPITVLFDIVDTESLQIIRHVAGRRAPVPVQVLTMLGRRATEKLLEAGVLRRSGSMIRIDEDTVVKIIQDAVDSLED